ncbi:MAG TPA: indole-3-glycerol phosphate synthase TrpC [Vicinamibacterales bacterium]|nr:indole-3-glycerol phosphate synthase TrpC [Vicinamibacterales bacterium]
MNGGLPDLLETIVAAAKVRVENAGTRNRRAAVERRAEGRAPRAAAFARALAQAGRVNVIAECKRRSPSRGVLRAAYDPVAIATGYAASGAAAISVLTEPMFFDGALAHLAAVRAAVDTPLLRKDFIVDSYQLVEAVAHGADAVLLIAAALEDAALRALRREASALGLAVLVEVHSEDEFSRALDAGATLVGVNNRNLRTLEVDIGLSERLAPRLFPSITGVSESGLRSADDIGRLGALGYRAFLMGERFMTTPHPGDALRAMLVEAV